MRDIVVLDGYTTVLHDLDWSPLDLLGKVTVYDRTPPELTLERMRDAEIVLTNKTHISADVIAHCPRLVYVGVTATGYNVIDLDAARARGITVTNVPNYSSDAVSQFVFALLLHIVNAVDVHNRAVHEGVWSNSPDFTFQLTPQIELNNLTMGIFGTGAIGRRVAAIAQAFGMRVLAHTRRVTAGEHKGLPHVDFDTLIEKSDVLSLHAPLTDETEGVFDKAVFARMKPGAILINTARGPLINEQDLANALNSGHIYAAALDVVSVEPIQPDNPLLSARNCLITPHMAFATGASRRRLRDAVVRNVENFLDGDPTNVVS